ncbi:MAG: metalloregulator ArsR/SmtB family transcription factor [Chloroflexi bacterium]|nr:metalloregulator ArsR/SmtB family transcription factor [Chloroflexota bacterium]
MESLTIQRLGELFSAVADTTRLRIILLIRDHGTRSTDIAAKLDMTASAISHQLRWLRERRIVKAEKIGRETYYSLNDECIAELLEVALRHLAEEE